jgi:hypothetical protein
MESQEGQEGQEGIADSIAAWFAVKVALTGLALHLAGYVADCPAAGDAAAIVFLAGWLFGVRNLHEEDVR